MKFTVTEKDRGWKALFERLEVLKKHDVNVRVGIFSDEKGGGEEREGGLTNVEIAAVHEFGAPEANIPERPFIRSTFDAYKQEYAEMVTKVLRGVIEGKLGVKQALDLVGAKMVADINKVVRQTQGPAYGFAPLKPETIDRKGSSRPLIDTGRMIAAVTWAVFFGDQKVGA